MGGSQGETGSCPTADDRDVEEYLGLRNHGEWDRLMDKGVWNHMYEFLTMKKASDL